MTSVAPPNPTTEQTIVTIQYNLPALRKLMILNLKSKNLVDETNSSDGSSFYEI